MNGRAASVGVLLLAAAACGVKPTSTTTDGGLIHRTNLSHMHVTSCEDASQCGDGLEPPVGGQHCPVWLNCRVWDTPQPRCEYIHNLEHGHIVLAYNCPSGCPDIVAQLTAYWMSKPTPRRILVTPDPLLTTKVACMVWGWAWEGDHVDTAMFDEVVTHQDQETTEAGLPCDP
jgi:hypothetical protein